MRPSQIWGLFAPCKDIHTRKEVYSVLQTEMQSQDRKLADPGRATSCLGDMSAALHMDCRQTSLHPEDAMHQELMQTLKMHTTDKHQGMPKSWSYHSHGCNSSENSRIDDIFISECVLPENTCHHQGRYYRRLRPQPNICHHPTDIHELHETRT